MAGDKMSHIDYDASHNKKVASNRQNCQFAPTRGLSLGRNISWRTTVAAARKSYGDETRNFFLQGSGLAFFFGGCELPKLHTGNP